MTDLVNEWHAAAGAMPTSSYEYAKGMRDAGDALAESVDDLRVSLGQAIDIIEKHVPREALGMNAQGDPDVPGGYEEWQLLDEYLHHMKASLAKVSATVHSDQRTSSDRKAD